jgi:hypothetical protein
VCARIILHVVLFCQLQIQLNNSWTYTFTPLGQHISTGRRLQYTSILYHTLCGVVQWDIEIYDNINFGVVREIKKSMTTTLIPVLYVRI